MKLLIKEYRVFFLSLFIAHRSMANDINDYQHLPFIEVSAIHNKFRNINSINMMIPFIQRKSDLFAIDIKLMGDNKKNCEYNLGLLYRYNFDDRWIFGVYNYFDRRKTSNKLYVNQWTGGLEILSNYFDARFNLYIPQNKKELLTPKSVSLIREHTKIHALARDETSEQALPGYDIEIGIPVFSLFPKIDPHFNTRMYIAKYDFSKKSVGKSSGLRFRLEHKINEGTFFNNKFPITFSAGTYYTDQKKWSHFIGMNIRFSLSRIKNVRKNNLQERMTDTVIRDIDIITQSSKANTGPSPVYVNGKVINNIYFVGEKDERNYTGDGSYEKPFSREQLMRLVDEKKFVKKDTDLILPLLLDKNFTETAYTDLIEKYSVNDLYETPIALHTHDETIFKIHEYFPDLYSKEGVEKKYEENMFYNDFEQGNDYALSEKDTFTNSPSIIEEYLSQLSRYGEYEDSFYDSEDEVDNFLSITNMPGKKGESSLDDISKKNMQIIEDTSVEPVHKPIIKDVTSEKGIIKSVERVNSLPLSANSSTSPDVLDNLPLNGSLSTQLVKKKARAGGNLKRIEGGKKESASRFGGPSLAMEIRDKISANHPLPPSSDPKPLHGGAKKSASRFGGPSMVIEIRDKIRANKLLPPSSDPKPLHGGAKKSASRFSGPSGAY